MEDMFAIKSSNEGKSTAIGAISPNSEASRFGSIP